MYYRAIIIDPTKEESDEAVQYVGVYVLHWHDRPPQPEVGFVPVEGINQLLDAARKTLEYLDNPTSPLRHADVAYDLQEALDKVARKEADNG